MAAISWCSMMLADSLANYLYVVRYLVILLMLLLLFFAIDDLFVDLYYLSLIHI